MSSQPSEQSQQGQQGQPIPLSSLSLEELDKIKTRTEQDVESLAKSMEALGVIISKFAQAREALSVMVPENQGKRVLVPITNSLYVSATLDDPSSVLINVGAQYFIRKGIPQAKEYATRRIEGIKQNIFKIEKVVQQKQRLHEGVIVTMKQKIQQQEQPHQVTSS